MIREELKSVNVGDLLQLLTSMCRAYIPVCRSGKRHKERMQQYQWCKETKEELLELLILFSQNLKGHT